MTVTDACQINPLPQPIVLFEISEDQLQELFSYAEPGIPMISLTAKDGVPDDLPFWNQADSYNQFNKQLSEVQVYDGSSWTTYTEVSSMASLRTQNESWYFDFEEQNLYMHFDSFNPWWTFESVRIGLTAGFSDNGYHSGTAYYPPALKSRNITISYSKDPLFYGKSDFTSLSVHLLNDGSLDNVADSNWYGKVAKIKLGFSEVAYADFKTLFSGKVEFIPEIKPDTVRVDLADQRKLLNRTIPVNRYSQTTHTDLSDDNANKPIPLLFGSVRKIPCVCLNEEESGSPANYTFQICDPLSYGGISSIDAVYVEGTEVTPGSTNLTACTFVLSSAQVGDNFDAVTADATGYEDGSSVVIDNGLYVMRELLRLYDEKEYIAANFNTTNWTSEESSAADIGLLISDEETLGEVLGRISHSMFGMFYVQMDGKFNFVSTDSSRAVTKSIDESDILNEPYPKYNPSDLVAVATVKYSPDGEGNYRRIVDDSEEDNIYNKFRQRPGATFETLLAGKTDAETWGGKIVDIAKDIPRLFPVDVSMKHIDIEWLDNVNAEINQVRKTWFWNIKTEVIGYDLHLGDMRISLLLRYIEDV